MVQGQGGQADEITQAQQSLDNEAAQGAAGPQYVSVEQFQQLQQAIERQNAMIAGLQGKFDRGLNVIRTDTENLVKQHVGGLQDRMSRQAYLNSLSEEQRAVVDPLLREVDSLRSERQPARSQPQPEQDPAQAQWQQVYDLVADMGVDPRTPGIDYAALSNASLDQRERNRRFFASIDAAKATATKPAPAPRQAAPAAKTQGANPPVETAAAGRGGYRNIDDLRDAYINGRISSTEYRQKAQSLGHSV